LIWYHWPIKRCLILVWYHWPIKRCHIDLISLTN